MYSDFLRGLRREFLKVKELYKNCNTKESVIIFRGNELLSQLEGMKKLLGFQGQYYCNEGIFEDIETLINDIWEFIHPLELDEEERAKKEEKEKSVIYSNYIFLLRDWLRNRFTDKYIETELKKEELKELIGEEYEEKSEYIFEELWALIH